MSIRLVYLRSYLLDGEIDELDLSANSTVLVGPRNSSKSTTLRMIDYCLGDDDTAAGALGPDVAGRYAGLELDIELPTGTHTIRRSFVPTFGKRTRVLVDADLELTTRALSDWILGELGWPAIEIPKGRVAAYATELVPLTFRTLWRHLYRREDSWLVFANQEQEFHRRAVLAFFLGLAEQRYSNVEFEVAAAERRAEEIRQQIAAHDRLADETVGAVARELGLPETSPRLIDQRDQALAAAAAELSLQRDDIAATLRASEGFVSEASRQFDTVSDDLAAVRAQHTALSGAAEGYRAALAADAAEIGRLERAATSVELLSALPVTICPVCGQDPPHERDWPVQTGRCYLCDQAVVADVRDRRIRLEQQIVGRERAELEEVLERTEDELKQAYAAVERLHAARERLGVQIDGERHELLAPFVAQLEELSRRAGAIEQQRAALAGLSGLSARRAALERQLVTALEAVDMAQASVRQVEWSRRETYRRCAAFAERMTEFLNGLSAEPWTFGRVTLAEEELSFYVGGGPWDMVLGGESKVLFLLAYQYALLHLTTDLPAASHAPGLAVLDNPLQQGIKDTVMAEALDLLFTASDAGGQVLVTVPHRLPLRTRPTLHQLRVQYGGITESEA
jgi:hypothetical protein